MGPFGTMTLRELIDQLSAAPQDACCEYSFGYFRPTTPASYRGYYDHLALGYSDQGEVTVADVLAALKGALHHTYEGWKGGSYFMGRNTPVWADNPGSASGTRIVAVNVGANRVILQAERDHD